MELTLPIETEFFALLLVDPASDQHTRMSVPGVHVRPDGHTIATMQLVVREMVGGQRQIRAIRQGANIVVATPGRLEDYLRRKLVDLRKVRTLVLDEADRMLDMGFIRDVRKIVALLPKAR